MTNITYTNARIIDPQNQMDFMGGLVVQNGHITDIGPEIKAGVDGNIINCNGDILCPAFVDLRANLRDPASEEECAKLQLLAMNQGFGAVVLTPAGKYILDDVNRIRAVLRQEFAHKQVKIHCYGAITKGFQAKEMTEMGLMMRAGAVGFTENTHAISDSLLMMRIMEYADSIGALLLLHPLDNYLSSGDANYAPHTIALGMRPSYPIAEEIAISRDIALLKHIIDGGLNGLRIHFSHITTAGAVQAIRLAQAQGLPITCDCTAWHFSYNHEKLDNNYNTTYKLNPPLRAENDRLAIIQGLQDGTIGAIASDYTSLRNDDKNTTFLSALPGGDSYNQFWQLCLQNSQLPLPKLIEKLTINPAKILNITDEFGSLARNMPANITKIDQNGAKLLHCL